MPTGDINMQLYNIMYNVQRVISHYNVDENVHSRRKISITENKKRRTNLLEKIVTCGKTAEVREKALVYILAWLEEWNAILSEMTAYDIDEHFQWIAQMEMLSETFKATKSNVNMLSRICTSLLEEKKKQKKKKTSRGTLWKSWKERVTKQPATAHALRQDQMISDPSAIQTKVSEIQDMLQELIGTAMFNKVENNAIKYISSTIVNLLKALTILKDEAKVTNLQSTNMYINEASEREKEVSLKIIQDLSEKNEMLQQKLQELQEKCEQLIQSRNFIKHQVQTALPISVLEVLPELSPHLSMTISKADIEDTMHSIFAKEIENTVDEIQRKGAKSLGINWDSGILDTATGEMTPGLTEQQYHLPEKKRENSSEDITEEKISLMKEDADQKDGTDQDQSQNRKLTEGPHIHEISGSNLRDDKSEQKVSENQLGHHFELQTLEKKKKEIKSFSEARPRASTDSKSQHIPAESPAIDTKSQGGKSETRGMWEQHRKVKTEYSLDKHQISSENKEETTTESVDKASESKIGSQAELFSLHQLGPSSEKVKTKGKKHQVSPGTTKSKKGEMEETDILDFAKKVKPHELVKSQPRITKETSESMRAPGSLDGKTEQGNLEEFQEAVLAFLTEKISNIGKPLDKKTVPKKLSKRAEVETLGIIKAKMEEYFQNVADTVIKTLRKHKDMKNAAQIGEKAVSFMPGSHFQKPISAKSEISSLLSHENMDPIIENLIQRILTEVESERDVSVESERDVSVAPVVGRDHKEKEKQRQEEYLQEGQEKDFDISFKSRLQDKRNLWTKSNEIVSKNLKEEAWFQMKEGKQGQQKQEQWQEEEVWKEQQKQRMQNQTEQDERQRQSKVEEEEHQKSKQQQLEAWKQKMKEQGVPLEKKGQKMRQVQMEIRHLDLESSWEEDEEKQKPRRKVEDHEMQRQKKAKDQMKIKEKNTEELEKLLSKTSVTLFPRWKSIQKDVSQLYQRKVFPELKILEILADGKHPIPITPPTSTQSSSPGEAQALGITPTSQQVQVLGDTPTPKMSQGLGVTHTNEQAQALRAPLILEQIPKLKIPFKCQQLQVLEDSIILEQAQALRIPTSPEETQTLKVPFILEQQQALQVPLMADQEQIFQVPINQGQDQAQEIVLTLKELQALGVTVPPEQAQALGVTVPSRSAQVLGITVPPELAQTLGVSVTAQQAPAQGITLTSEKFQDLGITLTHEQVQVLRAPVISEQAESLQDLVIPEQVEAPVFTFSPEKAQTSDISRIHEQAQAMHVTLTPEQAQASGIPLTLDQAEALQTSLTSEQAYTSGVSITPEIHALGVTPSYEQSHALGTPFTLDLAQALEVPIKPGNAWVSAVSLTPEQTQALGVPLALEQAQSLKVSFSPEQFRELGVPLTSDKASALGSLLTSEQVQPLGAPFLPGQTHTMGSTLMSEQDLNSRAPLTDEQPSQFCADSGKLLAPQIFPSSGQTLVFKGLASEVPLTPGKLPKSGAPPTPGQPLAPEAILSARQLLRPRDFLTSKSHLMSKAPSVPRQPLISGLPPTSAQIPSLWAPPSPRKSLVPGASSIPGELLESGPLTLSKQSQVFQPPTTCEQFPYLQAPSTLEQHLTPLTLPGQASPPTPPTPRNLPTQWASSTTTKAQENLSSVSKKSKKRLAIISSLKSKSALVHPSAPNYKVPQAPITTKKFQISEVSDTGEENQILHDPFSMEQFRTFQSYLTNCRIPISQTPHIDDGAFPTLKKPIASLPPLTTKILKTSQISPSEWDQKSRFPYRDKPWILTAVSDTKKPKMTVPPSSTQELNKEQRYFVDVEAQRKNLILLNEATKASGLPSQLHTTTRNLIIEALHMDTVRLGHLFRKYIAYWLIQRARNNIIKRLQAIQNTGKGYEAQKLYIMLSRIDDYQKKVMQFWTKKQKSLEEERNRCLRKMMFFFSQLQKMYNLNLSQPIPLIVNKKLIPATSKFVQQPLLELLIEEDRKSDVFKKFRQEDQMKAIWNADLSTSSYPVTEKKSTHSLWAQLGGYPDIPRLLQLDVQSTFRKSLASIQSQFKKIPK
ncbi:hypothetical protein MUG91_G188n53 [Manis pentadactyla]|nr:hypothetical protein MUG91_G188n53 [Manis pentadactyla]